MQTISSLNPNENWQALINGKKGKCLDLGCGYGADAYWFTEHGWQVDALDYNDEIKFQHPMLNFIKADFRRVNLITLGRYDLIIACFILHYFNNNYKLNLIKKLLFMLNKGGILYLKIFEENFTPQMEYLLKDAKIERYEQTDDHPPDGKHVHHIVKIICQT